MYLMFVQHASRLLECWSDSIHHALVGYYFLFWTSDGDVFLNVTWASFYSGSHPFDYGPTFYSSSDWLSHVTNSRGLDSSQLSQNYVRTEAKLKARIVDGQADFQFSPWNILPEGFVSTALPSRPTLTHVYLARTLVQSLLCYDYVHRATVKSALQARWIICELQRLDDLYEQRIITKQIK